MNSLRSHTHDFSSSKELSWHETFGEASTTVGVCVRILADNIPGLDQLVYRSNRNPLSVLQILELLQVNAMNCNKTMGVVNSASKFNRPPALAEHEI